MKTTTGHGYPTVTHSWLGDRRSWLGLAGAAALLNCRPVGATPEIPVESARGLHFGLTPVTLSDRVAALDALSRYLQQQLGASLLLSPRTSYRQVMDQLKHRQLDFAWVSAMPYVYLESRHYVRLVATPVYRGDVTYRACLIVGAADRSTRSIADLGGRVFAYSDPFSLTGRLLPQMALRDQGKDPATFFRKTFFTGTPQNVIEAVLAGLADAGSVDSYVWESVLQSRPQWVNRLRLVSQSSPYGFPPIVASRSASDSEVGAMQQALVQLSRADAGMAVLQALNLDGFRAADPSIYRSAQALLRIAGEA